jgi:hypothetical protein
VFRCPDGTYSSSKSFREVQSILDWFILLFILAAFVFTIVINSYWPILLSMFRSIKNVLKKQDQTCADMKDVVKKLDGLTRISFSVKSPPSQDGSPSDALVSSASSSSWGLWCLTFVCLACSFSASLFIASACYSLWISSLKPTLEPICVPVSQNSLQNTNTKELISILYQNENETVIIMPCDGSVVDEAGNVYRLKGPYELQCGDFVTFNYTTHRDSWSGNQCGGEPKLPSWKHRNAKHMVKEGHFPPCVFCYLWCVSIYRCDTVPVELQLCEWVETESYFTINDVRLNETMVSLTISPSMDARYGFWRNESGIFIRTADWLFMEHTVFNYSCAVTNPNPP